MCWGFFKRSRFNRAPSGVAAIRFAAVCPILVSLIAVAGDAIGIKAEHVADGFSSPAFITHAPGGNRLFVVELGGLIKIIDNGTVLPKPFADFTGITELGGEKGLLCLAFHPDYTFNRRVFCAVTIPTPDEFFSVFIVELQAGAEGNTADVENRTVILEIDQHGSNHNGGTLAFGPDGYLYWSSGDGGGSYDPRDYAQDLRRLRGKILRIDLDGGVPYAIPPSNPFVGVEDAREEIWAFGVRNPWRLSFDRVTGDLWFGDVGQQDREEINYAPASSTGGENYGWDIAEGFACAGGDGDCGTMDGFTPPIYDYPRVDGRSVTGGYVYRGARIPELYGHYVFADFSRTRLWSMLSPSEGKGAPIVVERTSELIAGDAADADGIVSFGEDAKGELYFASFFTGEIFKIRRTRSIADVTGDDATDANDVQTVINDVLGISTSNLATDIDRDGDRDASDVQLVINFVLGLI